jgi:hypothetical protein
MYVPIEKASKRMLAVYEGSKKNLEEIRDSDLVPEDVSNLPESDSYHFVLRRFNIGNNNPGKFISYAEVTRSYVTDIDGQKAHTIFLKEESSAIKAQSIGWFDCTESFKRWYLKNNPRPTSPPQQEIVTYLMDNSGTWYSKKEILRNTKVPDSQWRTAMKALTEKGIVLAEGTSMKRKYKLAEENG